MSAKTTMPDAVRRTARLAEMPQAGGNNVPRVLRRQLTEMQRNEERRLDRFGRFGGK